MFSMTRLAAVVSIAILGTGIALSVSQGPEIGTGGAPATESRTTEADAQPLPELGILEPGRYAGETYFGAEIEFTVEEGWNCVGLCTNVALGWGGTGRQLLAISRFEGDVHVAPCYVPDESVEGEAAELAMTAWLGQPANIVSIDATPESFWSHLMANPHLSVAPPAQVRVGGHEGLQADVVATVGEGCFGESTFVWHEPDWATRFLDDGSQARFTALDVDGEVIVLAAMTWPDGGDHQAFLEAAHDVMASLSISHPDEDR